MFSGAKWNLGEVKIKVILASVDCCSPLLLPLGNLPSSVSINLGFKSYHMNEPAVVNS